MDNNNICEYSGLPSVQSYEPKGVGVGGESLKENFIDSSVSQSVTTNEVSSDWMYNWIRKHSKK